MLTKNKNGEYRLWIDLQPPDGRGVRELAYISSWGMGEADLIKNAKIMAYDGQGKPYEVQMDEWMWELIMQEWLCCRS